MKRQSWIVSMPFPALAKVAICALMFCSGCLHHSFPVMDGYRIEDKSGLAMLVPDAAQNSDSGEFQSVTFTLAAAPAQPGSRAKDYCAVRGDMFSLSPAPGRDRNSWIIRSPSATGWDTVSGRMDPNAQWRIFVRELARMHDQGCFAPVLSTQFIRSSIAERIPLPANLVPTFIYSDQGERFVNLAPGMQVRIQKVLSTGTSADAGSGTSLRLMTVDYDVVPRHGGGIGLKLSGPPDGIKGAVLAAEDRQLLSLVQRFSAASVMRLFLQGFSEEKQGKSESAPILVGTSNATQLDALTDLMRQRESIACVSQPAADCVNLPSGGVSLSSILWINGRRTATAFGTSLGSLFLRLPEPKQAGALESVQVIRKLSPDRYASVHFPRTVEGVTQLLLLPGDRVDWKE